MEGPSNQLTSEIKYSERDHESTSNQAKAPDQESLFDIKDSSCFKMIYGYVNSLPNMIIFNYKRVESAKKNLSAMDQSIKKCSLENEIIKKTIFGNKST
jgi:hypothetical protein